MNRWQAIHDFWSGFDIPAYDENSVPDDAVLPYITYSASVSNFEDPVILSASIWYRSTLWREVSLKADEISESIGSFLSIPLDDDEYMFVVKGSPFAQRLPDSDNSIKRVYINIEVEFFVRD